KLAGMTVLLCEDHPVNTDLIKLILENSDINTVCAGNGREGIDIFSSSAIGHFDAVIMDICMPFMDGIEATKAIREMDREDAKKVPVIAMTANVFHEDREKLFEAGMTGFLSKPVDVEMLFKTLEEQCM
ncbi:MAG: response regulator, partial [Lachnospiraceae bacterium]